MKKLLLTLSIIVCAIQHSYSQMHITTYLTRTAIYNEYREEYEEVDKIDEVTFFEFNKGLTLFEHTTNTIKSSYTIQSSKQDKVNERWEFIILSDVGNKYMMIIDFPNNNLRFICVRDGVTYLKQYSIKRVWFDE